MTFHRIFLTTWLVVGFGVSGTLLSQELEPTTPAAGIVSPSNVEPTTETALPTPPVVESAEQYMARLQADIELAHAASKTQLEIEPLADETIKLMASNDVLFAVDRSDALPELLAQLDRLAPTLLKFTKTTLTVVTHTDDTGGAFFNRDLSRRRAEVARNYLLKLGISSERLATEGRGGDQPRDSNDSEAGQERNRRMEIYIRPSLQ